MEYKIKKSRFLVFILSLVPGGGHMYLGLLKQGLELMCMFFGILSLSYLLELGPLSAICPILVFYSIFDALSKRESDFDDKDAHCDIINWIFAKHAFPQIGSKFIGWALVVIGAIFVVSNFLPRILEMFNLDSYDIMHMIKIGITAIILIGGGLYIALRKPNSYYLEEGETDNDKQ